MSLKTLLPTLLLLCLCTLEIKAYGRLQDPVHRGGAWRKGFKTPINYNDHANNCGGYSNLWDKNKGKCGPCGDDYSDKQPRKNENGGYYGTGTIVRRYKVNQTIDVEVEITANIRGYFVFSLCKLNKPQDLETESCFEAHPLYLDGKHRKHYLSEDGKPGLIKLKVPLPKNLVCERCVLRWHYRAGNNWGVCEDGSGKLGCGRQETFRTCSDISIEK